MCNKNKNCKIFLTIKPFWMEDSKVCEPVIVVNNVDFELEVSRRNPGVLSLYVVDKSYVFEWVPDPSRDAAELSDRNIPPKVTIPLKQVLTIQRFEGFRTVRPVTVLKLTMTGSSELPRFIFCDFGDLFVTHLLEFLCSKNVIHQNQLRPTVYYLVGSPETETEKDVEDDENLTCEEVVGIAQHNAILRKLNFRANAQKHGKRVTVADLHKPGLDFGALKKQIFANGLAPAARPFVWPVLFKAIPFTFESDVIEKHLKQQCERYCRIQEQHDLLTKEQIEESRVLQDIERVIDNDVKRNDRKTDAFRDDESPNLVVLRRVLTAYSMYNRDTGYVQGMNDLLSPLITLYIAEWIDGVALFYDGSKKTMTEAESFLFWNFVGMMEMTHHERLFADLAVNQAFALERCSAIAEAVHPPLKELLRSPELMGLSFMFRPMLLMYKRAFKEDVFRLWDSLFTSDSPPCFIRFVSASILILLFPKLVIHTNGTLGEVMSFADGFFGEVELSSVLNLASILVKEIDKLPRVKQYAYELIPDRGMFKKELPKYFELLH